jgi:hypothetical protein
VRSNDTAVAGVSPPVNGTKTATTKFGALPPTTTTWTTNLGASHPTDGVKTTTNMVPTLNAAPKASKHTVAATVKPQNPLLQDRDQTKAEEAAMRVESRQSGIIDDKRARARVQWPLYCHGHMKEFVALLARRGVCVCVCVCVRVRAACCFVIR